MLPCPSWSASLPKRDIFILPLISIATVCTMLAAGEIGARLLWTEALVDSCGFHDTTGRLHFRPNCESFTKDFDTAVVENRYNECGYRSEDSCLLKTPNQREVAVIGTSFSYGQHVAYPFTFAGRLAKRLQDVCQQPVNIQVLAQPGANIADIDRQVEEALPLRPDAFVMAISDYDVRHTEVGNPPSAIGAPDSKMATSQSLGMRIMKELEISRFLAILRLYRSLDAQNFIHLYLSTDTDNSDFMRSPLNPLWTARLQRLEQVLGNAKALMAKDGIPFILTLVPSRAMIALTQPEFARPGIDPRQLSRRLSGIAKRLGIIYADATDDFATTAGTRSLIYAWNGHPTAAGHAILAKQILDALLDQSAFSGCNRGGSNLSRAATAAEDARQ